MRRFVAALNAFWFVLALGAPQWLHACPEHSPQQVATAPEHSEHAHHGASQTPEKESNCCCPGPQCGSQAPALTTTAPALDAPVADTPAHNYGSGPALTHVAWLLPYATAPPASPA